jgi:hypothetical protein
LSAIVLFVGAVPMAPFPELLKVVRLALMPPAKVKHRKPHQATVFISAAFFFLAIGCFSLGLP